MFFLIGFVMLSSLTAIYAQSETTVSGTITDQGGEALIGASIIIKGTSQGTTSDFDGKFSLKVPDAQNSILVFSYTGYQNQEVVLNGQSTLSITLRLRLIWTRSRLRLGPKGMLRP